MAAQTQPTESPAPRSYAPRDPIFFLHAACLFAAALQPSGRDESDRDAAEAGARDLAAVLDGGPVPKDLILPRFARQLEDLSEAEAALGSATAGAPGGTPSNPRALSAGSVLEIRKARQAAGKPTDPRAIASEKERVISDHAGLVARLGDLSEPVRAAALAASVTRIAARPDLTGAPHLMDNAFGIVVEEIERAIRTAEGLEIPARGIGSDAGRESASNVAPYPANVVLELFQAATEAIREGAAHEGQEGTHVQTEPTETELRAMLADELRRAGKESLAALATAPEGPAVEVFAGFADLSAPGAISPKLRELLGLDKPSGRMAGA